MTHTQTYFNAFSPEQADPATPHAQTTPAQKSPPTPPPPSLKITAAANQGRPLTKAQKAFNHLVAQIENLRKSIGKTRRHLDNALLFYAQVLHPLQKQITARRKQIILYTHPFLKTPKTHLPPRQRRTLLAFLSMQLDMILQADGNLGDPRLQAIFAEVEGMTLQEAQRQERAQMREELEDRFEDLGMDIDLSAFNEDMTPEEFTKARIELEEKLKTAMETDPDAAAAPGQGPVKPRKKTKKQLASEAREQAIAEARTRSLSSIYKQLARAFHPDLEQNPERKAQKLLLMQELTVAYRANDMHTLLRLELEWLQNKEHDAERLSDEKLAIYNEVLREQIETLREEEDALSDEPRYEVLSPFADMFGDLRMFNGRREQQMLSRELDALCSIDLQATGTNALKKLKTTLKQFEREFAHLNANDRFTDAIKEMMMMRKSGMFG